MKLKEILKESDYSKNPVQKKFNEFMDDIVSSGKYSDALNSKVEFWRGIRSDLKTGFIIQDSSKFSQDRYTKGIIFLSWNNIQKVVPEWSKFPNRNRSIIFTNNKKHATIFSNNIVKVFPINGAKIGVAPTDYNYFNEWPKLKKYFEDEGNSFIVDGFVDLFRAIIILNRNDPTNTKTISNPSAENYFAKHYNSFIKLYNKNIIDKIKFNDIYNNELHSFLATLEKEFNGNLKKMMDTLLSPSKNNFEVITTKKLNSVTGENQELWTEDKCLMVDRFLYDEWLDNKESKK